MKAKQFVIQSISSTILFACVSNVFAADVTCPPTEFIKKIKFTQALQMNSSKDWRLLSDSFNYEGNQFSLELQLYDIFDTKWQDVALKEGQLFFNQASLYSEPYRSNPDSGDGLPYIHCKYWEGNGGYYVDASTPPYLYNKS